MHQTLVVWQFLGYLGTAYSFHCWKQKLYLQKKPGFRPGILKNYSLSIMNISRNNSKKPNKYPKKTFPFKGFDDVFSRLSNCTGCVVGLAAAWMFFVNSNLQTTITLVSLANVFVKAAQISVEIQKNNRDKLDEPNKPEDKQ